MFKLDTVSSWEQLAAEIKQDSIPRNLEAIQQAYSYAEKVYAGHTRKCGELLIVHALTVAAYVHRLALDDISVIAGLLHEVTDLFPEKLNELDRLFGADVALIVGGLTDLKTHSHVFVRHNEDPVNFRNLIIQGADDVRVLIVRLANKLHNILSIKSLDQERQMNQAYKVLYVYAPLCEYLGLGSFQAIFETEAFKIVKPEAAQLIADYVNNSLVTKEESLQKLKQEILNLLAKYSVNECEISFRTKNLYSIYRKIKRKYLSDSEPEVKVEHLEKIKDVVGMRLVVDNIESCYLALGLIHGSWQYIPEEFDDYIVHPKESGYKSIHTVIEYEGTPVEVQIRTHDMHEYNEFGPASHIAYKLRSYGNSAKEQLAWTKELSEWKHKSNLTKEDFKIKAFAESIFVFTPKGQIIKLGKGATPIDFAFRIHTQVGAHYVGAKVNNQMRPMQYVLQTGDVVEILTAKNQNVNQDWLQIARLNSTKIHIRKLLRQKLDTI